MSDDDIRVVEYTHLVSMCEPVECPYFVNHGYGGYDRCEHPKFHYIKSPHGFPMGRHHPPGSLSSDKPPWLPEWCPLRKMADHEDFWMNQRQMKYYPWEIYTTENG